MLGISCTSVGLALVLLLVIICTLNEGFRSWKNALVSAWLLSKSLYKVFGIKYEIHGKENIIHDSGCIVLVNHQSLLDMAVLAELWLIMERCTVISKREVLYYGPFGLAAWLWGTIFIDRKNFIKSRDAINSTCQYIRDAKMKVLFFPEGKRYSNNTLMPFKKGPFHLAITSQVPILPVVVSKYYFLNYKSKKFGSGTSYITILPPIPTKNLTKDNVQELIDKSYEAMNTAFVQSSQKALTKHMESLQND